MNSNIPFSNRSRLQVAFAVVAVAAFAQISSAQIPYPHAGTPNPVTYTFTATGTGDVTAYFAGSGASYDEKLGLLDNGVLTSAGFGLDDHSTAVGTSFDFGPVTAGDTLTFVLDVTSPNLGFVYSDPALNRFYDTNGSDGHNHVYSTPYNGVSPAFGGGVPAGTYVGFEDLPFPGSDFNYFDETYVFTDVTTQSHSVPDPASSLLLLETGLCALAALRLASAFRTSKSLS